MAGRITRLRGITDELSQDVEDDDMTQPPTQPIFTIVAEGHVSSANVVVEDQVSSANEISDACGNPTSIQVLAPGALWFDSHSVVQVITDGIQSFFDGPYTCWKKSTVLAKGQWWRFFRDNFKWLSRDSHAVKKEYERKAGLRLKDMINKACKVPDQKHISWLSTEMRKRLKVARSTTAFKNRSKQCLHNRMGGPKAGTKHSQGSISATQIAKKMMKDTGILPTASELFLKTHQRSKDKSFCDPRAEKLSKDFESAVAAAVATQVDGVNDVMSASYNNDLFIKAAGGFSRQGSVYGVGNSVNLFYQRPSSSSKYSTQADSSPSVVSLLEQQLKTTTKELDATKKQLVEQKAMYDGHENQLANQKQMIQGLQDALNSMSQEMRRISPSQFSEKVT